jgi:hypothetical protein
LSPSFARAEKTRVTDGISVRHRTFIKSGG